MVCGRLTRRIAWVMVRGSILSREALFTLPKPQFQLSPHLVNIVLQGSKRRG